MILADERQTLRELLRARSVRTGEFVLASGAKSSYYIDARLTTMSGSGQLLIGRRGLAEFDARGWAPDAVGGLTLGADPVAYAIAHAAAVAGRTRSRRRGRFRRTADGRGSSSRCLRNRTRGNAAPATRRSSFPPTGRPSWW